VTGDRFFWCSLRLFLIKSFNGNFKCAIWLYFGLFLKSPNTKKPYSRGTVDSKIRGFPLVLFPPRRSYPYCIFKRYNTVRGVLGIGSRKFPDTSKAFFLLDFTLAERWKDYPKIITSLRLSQPSTRAESRSLFFPKNLAYGRLNLFCPNVFEI
jgi:hypothetical protein